MDVEPIKYADGNVAQIGDRIRIDNGEREGCVEDIVDSSEKIKEWGIEERGILVKSDYYGRVFIVQGDFIDDEIVLISRLEA